MKGTNRYFEITFEGRWLGIRIDDRKEYAGPIVVGFNRRKRRRSKSEKKASLAGASPMTEPVVEVVVGPAERSGLLKAGHMLVAVDGESLTGPPPTPYAKVLARLRDGAVGFSVIETLSRQQSLIQSSSQ